MHLSSLSVTGSPCSCSSRAIKDLNSSDITELLRVRAAVSNILAQAKQGQYFGYRMQPDRQVFHGSEQFVDSSLGQGNAAKQRNAIGVAQPCITYPACQPRRKAALQKKYL